MLRQRRPPHHTAGQDTTACRALKACATPVKLSARCAPSHVRIPLVIDPTYAEVKAFMVVEAP